MYNMDNIHVWRLFSDLAVHHQERSIQQGASESDDINLQTQSLQVDARVEEGFDRK